MFLDCLAVAPETKQAEKKESLKSLHEINKAV
jgi:hypothetical protein